MTIPKGDRLCRDQNPHLCESARKTDPPEGYVTGVRLGGAVVNFQIGWKRAAAGHNYAAGDVTLTRRACKLARRS